MASVADIPPPARDRMNEHVILLHGLWMRGFALAMLHRRMMEANFRVHRFDYLSVEATEQSIMDRLHERMTELSDGGAPVHLVGHSLGGLLALRACRDASLPPGRIVCLGSPLKGSASARGFSAWGHGSEVLLGHNRELIEQGLDRWAGSREVGMIAGSTRLGLGAMLGHLEGEHDGTVAVHETRLEGLSDHCVLEVNHTGLLFSADVAQHVAAFLRHGRFEGVEPPA